MPVEENKELRDLVTETLQKKGVLGKVQAEIRASVFLALEEQNVFKDKSPFINRQLKDFVKTSDGNMIISLVREFLEFFNLEFTSMVFDPETHAGIDYTYEGRHKLAKDLMLSNEEQESRPLLSLLIGAIQTNNIRARNGINFAKDATREKEVNLLDFDKSLNGINGDYPFQGDGDKVKTDETKQPENSRNQERTGHSKESQGMSSLSSLSNLPPLGKPPGGNLEINDYNFKAILDIGLSTNDDEEFLTQVKKDNLEEIKPPKVGVDSEESEIEEDLSRNSNISAPGDDNSIDITISKASGHGDYLEDGIQKQTEHKKKYVSQEGDGDKKSDISVSNKMSSVGDSTKAKKTAKLDYGPMTTNILPPAQPDGKCNLSNSTSSERADLDHSKCDTFSEIDDIEEEFLSSSSENPDNQLFIMESHEKNPEPREKNNKINDMFGNVKTLQTIDNAVTQIVKKKIPHLADLPLKDEIVIINQVDDAKEVAHTKKSSDSLSRILPAESRSVASVITQNDITIKINENPKTQDVSDRVMVGGQQLDKEEYKSIFQELEKGLGAKIESIFIPEEPKIQVTLTSPTKHDSLQYGDVGKKTVKEQKEKHLHGSLENRTAKSDHESSDSPLSKSQDSKGHVKRSLTKSPEQEYKINDNQKTSNSSSPKSHSKTDSSHSLKKSGGKDKSDKLDFALNLQNHKSEKHEMRIESNSPGRNRGSIGEKLKQVDTSNIDSFFKFGVDTSYEEFCKFKSEMLRLKGYHANKGDNDNSSCSLTSVSSCSKGKCEERILQKDDHTISLSLEGKQPSFPKVLPPLKLSTSSRKKSKLLSKDSDHASSLKEDSEKSQSSHTKKSKSRSSESRQNTIDIEVSNISTEQDEKTQDISHSSVSCIGDYMEPVSLTALPPRF
ncbi:uncharacterized protein LOC106674003 isoform X1 [Cimex lectularius]|uniref:FGFR1 oncogene partner (FOP) N-terminal dimerisation domain-containing protein n=1 Tax=Cimex lectularius TaxID=79782 RepID=A0A8I6SDK2_CIMLE|nr:uncharacterized protein LOC106674003 isoform X1 [Cimex lectularius]